MPKALIQKELAPFRQRNDWNFITQRTIHHLNLQGQRQLKLFTQVMQFRASQRASAPIEVPAAAGTSSTTALAERTAALQGASAKPKLSMLMMWRVQMLMLP